MPSHIAAHMDSAKFTTISGVTVKEGKIVFPQCFDGNIQIDVSYGTSYDLKNNDLCSVKSHCFKIHFLGVLSVTRKQGKSRAQK